MNREETIKLTRYVKGACPQQAVDEFTPNIWHDLLKDLRLEDCRQAVVAIARRQPFVSPSEIRDEVARIRADRIGPAGPGLSPIPPPADPDDPKAYIAALREQQARIADGREHVPAIEAGEAAGYDGNPHVTRIRAQFDAERANSRRRKIEQDKADRAALQLHRRAVDHLLGLGDHGAAALEAARGHLLGEPQAALDFPDLTATPGVMDEHKVTIWAARATGLEGSCAPTAD